MMKKNLLFAIMFSLFVPAQASALGSWVFFPQEAQKMNSYLKNIFLPSAECLEPSLIIEQDPLSSAAQQMKTAASRLGFYYDLTFNFNYSAMTPQPNRGKAAYTSTDNELWSTWLLAKSSDGKQGVFLMLEADWGQGINFNERRHSIQDSLGSLSNPQSALRGGNGVFIPNLSLAYSGWDGSFIAMVGTLDLSNFFDQDTYSDNWTGDLLNLSFNYNPCLPLFWANWGYMTAWQPNEHFYAMYATSGSNGEVNHNPFQFISSDFWNHVAEIGFIVDDTLGMGKGTYRFQYVITRHDSQYGGGAAINFQQQMGKGQSLGVFTRAGYMDEDAASVTGVKAAVTGGLVLMAPFTSSGWGSKANNEQLALGAFWERAAQSERPYRHKDEYGIELSAVVQLTPTMFIQPDVQYIFNPIHADASNGAFVFQVQTTLRF